MTIRGTLLKRGKVKDIYGVDGDRLIFHFTDRVSAFDVVLPSSIPRKGEVLCRFAAYWFNTLGIRHHMLELTGKDTMLVRKLRMIPIECVVRGYLYGSLYERVMNGEGSIPVEPLLAAKLPEPIFDPTTKFEAKDRPITHAEILSKGWLSKGELAWIKECSISIYNRMAERASSKGFIMADLKVEFGRDPEGEILLADSIGPDEFRLWPTLSYRAGMQQESYDKQPIRDYLASVGYKRMVGEALSQGKPVPQAPELPTSLIEETSRRYTYAYEMLTGERF